MPPPETRFYLRLRGIARKGGVPAHALHSPLALTRYLDAAGHPAAQPARTVVERYLRARFAGETLAAKEVRELKQAVTRVRSELRTIPLRTSPE